MSDNQAISWFYQRLNGSEKPVLKQLLNLTICDARTTTGANIRGILLLTDKLSVDQLVESDAEDINYHSIEDDKRWRIILMEELMEMRDGDMEVSGWDQEELDQIINFVCSN